MLKINSGALAKRGVVITQVCLPVTVTTGASARSGHLPMNREDWQGKDCIRGYQMDSSTGLGVNALRQQKLDRQV